MRTFLALIHGLTAHEKSALEELKIDRRLRSAWKTGRRLPTAAQVAAVAVVCQSEALPLYEELAVAQAMRRPKD